MYVLIDLMKKKKTKNSSLEHKSISDKKSFGIKEQLDTSTTDDTYVLGAAFCNLVMFWGGLGCGHHLFGFLL